MKKICSLFVAFLLTLTLPFFISAQAQERLLEGTAIKAGLGFEYFSRKIAWDEKYSSELKPILLTFNLELEPRNGLIINTILGYSFSNYLGLIFRELPFSLEIGEETKIIRGYLFGAEIKKDLISSENLEIEGLGQIFYYFGSKQEWEVKGLAESGTAQGRPKWWRVSIGPVFTYKRFASIYPYLYLNLNKLWGTFKVKEKVGDLEGTENQKISSKSLFSTALGFIYELTSTLSIKGEANFLPYKNGTDLGVMIKVMYSF